jgi:hypothetical protein
VFQFALHTVGNWQLTDSGSVALHTYNFHTLLSKCFCSLERGANIAAFIPRRNDIILSRNKFAHKVCKFYVEDREACVAVNQSSSLESFSLCSRQRSVRAVGLHRQSDRLQFFSLCALS